MKNRTRNRFIAPALLVLLTLNLQLSTARAQGTAFTYQGELQNRGNLANGTYNFAFTLFDTNTTGVAIAGPVTNNAASLCSTRSSESALRITVPFRPPRRNRLPEDVARAGPGASFGTCCDGCGWFCAQYWEFFYCGSA